MNEALQIELLVKGKTLLALLKKSNLQLKRFCKGIFNGKVLYACLEVTQVGEAEWRLLFEVQEKVKTKTKKLEKKKLHNNYTVQMIDYAEK